MLSRRVSRSDKVAALKNDTVRMIYTWLIPYLDVDGRMEANVDLLKADIAPLLKHITPAVLKNILNELHSIGLIILYSINGKQYLQLTQFDEHQKHLRKDREAPSRIPGPAPESLRTCSGPAPESLQPNISLREVKLNIRASFEKFWTEYPRKKSKGQAEKAFSKINPDEQLLATMIAKIEMARKSEAWIKENGKYIPYPATWLNAKGWEDVDAPAGNGTQPESPYTDCPKCHKEVLKENMTDDGKNCIHCVPRKPLSEIMAKIGEKNA